MFEIYLLSVFSLSASSDEILGIWALYSQIFFTMKSCKIPVFRTFSSKFSIVDNNATPSCSLRR